MEQNKDNVKIMIIDDDINSLLSLNRALQLHGYATEHFDDPLKALSSYKRGTYNVVVTDYKMPNMDGITLIGEIRRINPKSKIILFSGFIDNKLLEFTNKTNIDGVFHKPLALENFLQKLETLVF